MCGNCKKNGVTKFYPELANFLFPSEYFNILNGATDTIKFLNFFWEASQSVNELSGHPCLKVGDIVVMDNLAVHHYDGGLVLEEFLDEMGIELLYMPTYSPDLNPIELLQQSKNRIKWTVFSCGSRKPEFGGRSIC